ncbi:MAG: hypothetical protein K9J13_09190 [Saprospiraceae bacterium]|nr:hypothetical protein [Saprospiraceae bacterium]
MRNILLLILSFIIITSYYSCETDFDMNAEYKDITIVYGLLNQNETTHYVKINRAFLGNDNTIALAQDPMTSSYGDSLEVTLEEWRNSYYKRTFTMTDTLVERDPDSGSPFYNPSNPYQIIYKTKANLIEDGTYKLVIKNKYSGKIITSETKLIEDFTITKPNAGVSTIGFNHKVSNPTDVQWRSGLNGRLYQLVIRFYYIERDLNNIETKKYVDWVLGTKTSQNINGGEEMKLSYVGESFYKNIQDNVKFDPNVAVRIPDTVQFIFSVAADEFNTYMDINKPSSSIVQERPEYTNINNGIGIFSSRYIKIRGKLLNNDSQEFLKSGIYTSDLAFTKRIP